MNLSECFYLGYVSRVIGTKGRYEIKLDVDHPADYKELESVLILMNSKDKTPVPFFIDQVVDLKGQVLRVDLDKSLINSEILSLKGKEVYLPLSDLKPLSGNSFYYHEVIGFNVIDQTKGDIGKVGEINELPSNPVMTVNQKDVEILIPLRDEILLKVDRKNKKMEINAPDGLIDLYLS